MHKNIDGILRELFEILLLVTKDYLSVDKV